MPSLGRRRGPSRGSLGLVGTRRPSSPGYESEGPRGCRGAAPGGFTRDGTLPVHPRGDAHSSRTTSGRAAAYPEPGRSAEFKPKGPECVSLPLYPARAVRRAQEAGQRAQGSGQQVQRSAAPSLLRSELGPHGSGRATRAAHLPTTRRQPPRSAPRPDGRSPDARGRPGRRCGSVAPRRGPGSRPGWRWPLLLLLGADPGGRLAPLPSSALRPRPALSGAPFPPALRPCGGRGAVGRERAQPGASHGSLGPPGLRTKPSAGTPRARLRLWGPAAALRS